MTPYCIIKHKDKLSQNGANDNRCVMCGGHGLMIKNGKAATIEYGMFIASTKSIC